METPNTPTPTPPKTPTPICLLLKANPIYYFALVLALVVFFVSLTYSPCTTKNVTSQTIEFNLSEPSLVRVVSNSKGNQAIYVNQATYGDQCPYLQKYMNKKGCADKKSCADKKNCGDSGSVDMPNSNPSASYVEEVGAQDSIYESGYDSELKTHSQPQSCTSSEKEALDSTQEK